MYYFFFIFYVNALKRNEITHDFEKKNTVQIVEQNIYINKYLNSRTKLSDINKFCHYVS